MNFVIVGVTLGDGVGGGRAEGIVVRDVGRETLDEWRLAGGSPDLVEELRGGREVRGPAEPAGVASIDVLVHAGLGKVGERVVDTV